ncbi:hypothetical protein [Vulcanisaeta souniana]|nr:hypothetical protein [Vulcanisaeta souniana]
MTVVIGFNWPVEHDNAVASLLMVSLSLPVRRRGGQGTNTRQENHQ